MKSWLDDLRRDLDERAANHGLRQLTLTESAGRLARRHGRDLINLAGNDYLALADHPHLKQAAIHAVRRYGVGSGASRLVTGHQPLHAQVEQRFARFKHAQAALLCPSGFQANLAVVSALARKGDLVCVDKLNHASLLDAAAASGATLRVFPHLHYAKLERLLHDHKSSPGPSASPPRRLILTDSVFSMDGDVADLRALCDLAQRYDALLIVDEAHGTGVLGQSGAGLCELQGVADRVDIVVSTASKALGGLGGIVTAPQLVIDALVNRARPFIYSTAVPPAQAAVIDAALDVLRDEPHRRLRLLELSARVRANLPPRFELPTPDPRPPTPIIPLIVGSSEAALALSAHLESQGILAPAIRPPTVPPGRARVRLSLRCDLTDQDVDRLLRALAF